MSRHACPKTGQAPNVCVCYIRCGFVWIRGRSPPTLSIGGSSLRAPHETQHQIAEQPEDDEKAEQHQRVHPQRCVAALLRQNRLHRDEGGRAVRAYAELGLRITAASATETTTTETTKQPVWVWLSDE